MLTEFENLIRHNQGRIRAIVNRYANTEEREDLYQEILEQLWRSFDHFRGDAKLETWVYRVGFNTAMSRMRKSVKQRQDSQSQNTWSAETSTSDARCQAELLQEFLESLEEVDASILMMYLDALTAREMADVLGLRKNAVEVRITRIKKAFENKYLNEEAV